MKRLFINQQGDANKFWNIETTGDTYTVTFGKIGAQGRASTKQFPSREACVAEAEKWIREKTRNGYHELQEGVPIPAKQFSVHQPMDENIFWEVIAALKWEKSGDDDAVLAPAIKKLAAKPEADIFAFDELLAEKLYQLDGEKYAQACYGADTAHISGDDFLYCRCCVVANGKTFYEQVLQAPEHWPVHMEFENLLYLPSRAYARKTKGDEDDYEYDTKVSVETGGNHLAWPVKK